METYSALEIDQITHLSLRCERLETALAKMKSKAIQFKEERDQAKKKLREVQSSRLTQSSDEMGERKRICGNLGVAKLVPPSGRLADRVQLKRKDQCNTTVKPKEIMRLGVESTKVAEYLTRTTLHESYLQESYNDEDESLTPLEITKIELDRVRVEFDHINAQLVAVEISLNESRSLSDYLSSVSSQMESNSAAYQLAISYAIKSNQAYQYIIMLLNACLNKGLGLKESPKVDLTWIEGLDELEKVIEFVNAEEEACKTKSQRVKNSRKTRNNDKSTVKNRDFHKKSGCREADEGFCSTEPTNVDDETDDEENTSIGSPGPSSSQIDVDFKYSPNQLIAKLQSSSFSSMELCRAMLTTVAQVDVSLTGVDQSISTPGLGTPMSSGFGPTANCVHEQRIQLENAILMQEIMAVKEEKADIQAQFYLLEQDKISVELALKTKINELQALRLKHTDICESHYDGSDDMKMKIADLLDALEGVTDSNDQQQQHNQAMICDLRYANSVLLNVLDKMRRRFDHKFGRLKEQMDVLKLKCQVNENKLHHNSSLKIQ